MTRQAPTAAEAREAEEAVAEAQEAAEVTASSIYLFQSFNLGIDNTSTRQYNKV